MKKYAIKSSRSSKELIKIFADNVCYKEKFLVFIKDKKVVASFRRWDYWYQEEKEK